MNGYLYLVFIKNIYEIVGWKMFVSFLKSIGHVALREPVAIKSMVF
jgi:hypothetical protein